MQQVITEAKGFDLLTMGRPEGPKCYCAANHVLRKFIDQLADQYGYVVIDNEAGMEHLSRRTTNNVDLMLIVSEPTAVGKMTVKRIAQLAQELPISVKKTAVLWNKTEGPDNLDDIKVLGTVAYDEDVYEAAVNGKTIFDLDDNNAALSTILEVLKQKSITN